MTFRLLLLTAVALTTGSSSAVVAASRDSVHQAAAVRRPAPATVASPAGASIARKPNARMLEDIQIEGEIPVPQVLFVTARDQRRFLQFHHRRYLATSLTLGQSTLLPSGVVVTRTPDEPAKETPR